jgi:hypothetical protein
LRIVRSSELFFRAWHAVPAYPGRRRALLPLKTLPELRRAVRFNELTGGPPKFCYLTPLVKSLSASSRPATPHQGVGRTIELSGNPPLLVWSGVFSSSILWGDEQ